MFMNCSKNIVGICKKKDCPICNAKGIIDVKE